MYELAECDGILNELHAEQESIDEGVVRREHVDGWKAVDGLKIFHDEPSFLYAGIVPTRGRIQ